MKRLAILLLFSFPAKLVCQMTVRNGLVVWDLDGLAREDWHKSSGFHPDPRWEGQLPPKR